MSSYAVEFLGGPLDGHLHRFSYSPELLASTVTLPVNPNVLRILNGEGTEPTAPATSVAIYSLEEGVGILTYCYLGSIAADQPQLASWRT